MIPLSNGSSGGAVGGGGGGVSADCASITVLFSKLSTMANMATIWGRIFRV
jgi:hypothetical protein